MAKSMSTVADTVVSSRCRKLIAGIRHPFESFVSDFAAVSTKRVELAPRFMKACNVWQSETSGTFVSFVRLLDPKVPEQRAAYRGHSSFTAADYLRRLVARAEAAKESKQRRASGTVAVTPLEALARVMQSVLPLVSNPDALWTAFAQELKWSDVQVHRLQTLVSKAPAMLSAPKTAKPLLKVAA